MVAEQLESHLDRQRELHHRGAWGSLGMPVTMLTLGLLLLTLVSYMLHARALLAFPFEVDPGEGFDVNGALVLLQGGDLYGDATRFPFFALNYPPVYPLVLAPLVALFGPGIWVGRIISVVAGFGIGLVVTSAVSFPRAAFLPSVLAGLAFMASSYAFHVSPLARVTALMLFFGAAGLACLERGAEERSARPGWIVAGLMLLLAGVYTKPVGLDAMAAGLAYLAFRRPAGWPVMIAGTVAVGLLIHGLLEVASGGRYSSAVFTSNAYQWELEQAVSFWRNFLETHWPLLLLGLAGVWAHLLSRWMSVWVVYLLAGGITALTAGRWGAGESYFLPIVIASCVLGGRALAWGLARDGRSYVVGVGALGLFGLTGSAGPWPLHDLVPAWDRGFQAHALSRAPEAADEAAGREITGFVGGLGGPVFTEAAGFVLGAGGQVTGNPMLIKGLHAHDLYPTGTLVEAMRTRVFKGVILLGQWYPPDVLQAIGANYDQVERVVVAGNTYLLYRPRA
jgi:hypothetical protein